MNDSTNLDRILMGTALALGVLQCFAGYRLFRFFLCLTGFIVLGGLAAIAAWEFWPSPLVAAVAGLVGGLLGASAAVLIFLAGLFLVGAVLAVLLEVSILSAFGVQLPPLMLLFPAVVGGLLALLWQRGMIVVATAFEGAAAIVAAGAFFLLLDSDLARLQSLLEPGGEHAAVLLLAILAVAALGIWAQYRALSAQEKAPAREPIP